MKLIPYLMYNKGDCREAFEFYARALRGDIVALVTYGEMPAMPGCEEVPEETRAQIAHVHLVAGGASIMGGDGPIADGSGAITVNIDVDSIEQAERVFAELSAGGQVQVPLAETSWAHRWGMFFDRYGKPWMVNCMKPMG